MMHALYILLFMLVAAPLAAYIPLASLGAVLVIVAWNMAEKEEFWQLLRSSWGDAIVLLATVFLTIFEDLTTAIAIGLTLGSFLFLHRMAEAVEVETGHAVVPEDRADTRGVDRAAYAAEPHGRDVLVYRISGAFFFGATAAVNSVLDRIGEHPKVLVLDFSDVPLVDSTAANALKGFIEKLSHSGTRIYIAGAARPVRRTLLIAGLRKPLIRYVSAVEDAVAQSGAVDDPRAFTKVN